MLVSRDGLPLAELRQGAIIGTGSSRRRSQLLHARPDLQMADIRGNVDSRLRKVHEGQYDAIVLAQAGLDRLQLSAHITQHLPLSIMLPAVGQGALGLETRAADTEHAGSDLAARSSDQLIRRSWPSGRCWRLCSAAAWRRSALGGGSKTTDCCIFPPSVLSSDGRRRLSVEVSAPPTEALALGQRAAAELHAQGAAELIHAARHAE